jgi:hypothetical protein
LFIFKFFLVYYSVAICCHVAQPIPELSDEEIAECERLFDQVQPAFSQIKGLTRRNFLSSGFLLRKFSQILGLSQVTAQVKICENTYL